MSTVSYIIYKFYCLLLSVFIADFTCQGSMIHQWTIQFPGNLFHGSYIIQIFAGRHYYICSQVMGSFIRYFISTEITTYNRSKQNWISPQFSNFIYILSQILLIGSPWISSDLSIGSCMLLIVVSKLDDNIISLFDLWFYRCPEAALFIKCFRTCPTLGTVIQCSTVNHKLWEHLRPSTLAVSINRRVS